MLLKNIPRFITPTYEVNTHITYLIGSWLPEQEQDLGYEEKPDFQRKHVWSDKDRSRYMGYLFQAGPTGRDFYFATDNFYGNNKIPLVCVDGLQRLTTLRMFLNNEVKLLGHYLLEYEDHAEIKRNSNLMVNIKVLTIPTRNDMIDFYIKFNSSGVYHSEEDLTYALNCKE